MRSVWLTNRYLNQQVKTGAAFAVGWCKRKCRQAYLIESSGDERTAAQELEVTTKRFTHQWVAGAFAWWDGGAGHVAICCYQKGWVWTTDYPREGHWNRVPIADVGRWLGKSHRFRFFSRDIDGKTPVRRPLTFRRYRYPL